MMSILLRLLGHRAVHKALGDPTGEGGALDIKLGFALLRDRRVPIGTKLLALILGASIVALLVSLELPLEALLGLFVPFLALDGVVDGLEVVIGPLVLTALILPFLANKQIVGQIRAERAGIHGVVIDVESTTPETALRNPTSQPDETLHSVTAG